VTATFHLHGENSQEERDDVDLYISMKNWY
jgi:hypothetical protein